MKNCGHIPQIENSKEYSHIIFNFLKTCPQNSTQFQYWVFFRSVREKLTSVVVVGLQRSEISEFEVGSFFFFFKSD
jgi:hypothetical protein